MAPIPEDNRQFREVEARNGAHIEATTPSTMHLEVGPPSIQPPEISTRAPAEIAREMEANQLKAIHVPTPSDEETGPTKPVVRVEFPLRGPLEKAEELEESPTAIRKTITTVQSGALESTDLPITVTTTASSMVINVSPTPTAATTAQGAQAEGKNATRKVAKVWKEMKLTTPDTATSTTMDPIKAKERKIFYDYSINNRLKRPVRVEVKNARGWKIITRPYELYPITHTY